MGMLKRRATQCGKRRRPPFTERRNRRPAPTRRDKDARALTRRMEKKPL